MYLEGKGMTVMESKGIIRTKTHIIVDGKKMTKEEYFAMNKEMANNVINMIKKADRDSARRERG